MAEEALRALAQAGATIVDPADIPTEDELDADGSEFQVMLHEFHAGLDAYLAGRTGLPVRCLADVIAFNIANASAELPHFGQEILEMALSTGPLTGPVYLAALERSRTLAGPRGIDAVMERHALDALVAPTGAPAAVIEGSGGSSSAAARAGYPLISVPAGFVGDLAVSVTFIGRAYSEEAGGVPRPETGPQPARPAVFGLDTWTMEVSTGAPGSPA